jgi:hypothetical protein
MRKGRLREKLPFSFLCILPYSISNFYDRQQVTVRNAAKISDGNQALTREIRIQIIIICMNHFNYPYYPNLSLLLSYYFFTLRNI